MTEKQYRLNKWGTKLLKNNRPLFDWTNESDDIVDMLNALNDENEQLKTDNGAFIQDIEVFKEENTHLKLENEQLKSSDTITDLETEIMKLKEEKEQLKSQLYCDNEEGVCNICKHHYLIKDDEAELGYYNSRCKKGHYECARVSLKHCEDFEKEL